MRYQAALLPDWIRALGFKVNWRKDKDRLPQNEAEEGRAGRDVLVEPPVKRSPILLPQAYQHSASGLA